MRQPSTIKMNNTFGNVMDVIVKDNKSDRTSSCKPFVKWVGGKRSIIQELESRVPEEYNHYHEIFLGGGALFFYLQSKKSFLSDINPHLIITYEAIKKDVEKVILQLAEHKKNHSEEYYLKIRSEFSLDHEKHVIAGMFIYLNKTCYNGLYRVNQKGIFNVPSGKYTNPPILDKDNLRNCSIVLQNTTIKIMDYTDVVPNKNDFVYLDPPYYNTYDQYSSRKIDHKKLSVFCNVLNDDGVKFMLSNSNDDSIQKLYRKFHIEKIEAGRSISCKADQRKKTKELIIRNYG